MLCGWLISSVARLVVNRLPPMLRSTRSEKGRPEGSGTPWPWLLEGCSCWSSKERSADGAAAAATTAWALLGEGWCCCSSCRGPADAGAAVARHGTLGGGLPPLSLCASFPWAGGGPPPVCLDAGDGPPQVWLPAVRRMMQFAGRKKSSLQGGKKQFAGRKKAVCRCREGKKQFAGRKEEEQCETARTCRTQLGAVRVLGLHE